MSQYSLDLLFRFYQRNNKGHLVNAPYVDNSYKWGGGGFLSTVGDLVRFGNILLYAKQSGDDKSDNTGLISDNIESNCVNKKMLEYDWLLKSLINGLIDCFWSKVSDLTCPTYKHLYSDRPNRTVKQPIKIRHFMPPANELKLPSSP